MKYSISLVVPNYNGLELLQKNLSKIVAETLNYDKNTEIIVVDDGSKDESVSFVKKNFPVVKILKMSKNKGFSSAVNSGIKYSKGELIVLLNTDVIPEKNYITNTIKHFEDNKVFAVSFHERGYGWAKGYFDRGFIGHKVGGEGSNVHATFWVNGGSGIFRRKIISELGYFDEKLLNPFYWEDVDISYRAMKRGYKLLWEPNSYVVHKHESTISKISISKRNLVLERNQLIFIWKNITSKILFKKHLNGLLHRLITHPGYIKVMLAALFKIRLVIKSRTKELKESKVSDETILANFEN